MPPTRRPTLRADEIADAAGYERETGRKAFRAGHCGHGPTAGAGGRVGNVGILVAVGVDADGRRGRIRANDTIGRAEPGDPPAHARRGRLSGRERRVDARMRRNPLRHRERMVDPPLSGHVPAR